MKIFKYILLTFATCLLFASCEKDNLEGFDMDKVDMNKKALVQVFYVTPVTTATTNNVYKLTLNNQLYENNGSAIISTYNATPSGAVYSYYTVDAGDVAIKMWHADIDKDPFYSNTFNVQPGKTYQVFVHALNMAPTVIEVGELPTYVTTNTAEVAGVRVYNFMFEDANTPSKDKLQLRLKNTETGEYEPVSQPIGFGEATPWLDARVLKTTYNSGGSQRRDLDLMVVDGSNLKPLEYVKSNGTTSNGFTDYWTMYIGRCSQWILHGIRTDKNVPISIANFYQR